MLRDLSEFIHLRPSKLKVVGTMQKLAQKVRHSAIDQTNGVYRLDLVHTADVCKSKHVL